MTIVASGRTVTSGGCGRRLRLPHQPMLRHLVLALGGALMLFAVTSAVGPYTDYQIGQIGIDAVAIAGLTLLTGTSGQISLGQGAFIMVGAYGAGMLFVHTKLPIVLALSLGVLVSAAAGVLIGLPASRLRGPYLAGMTLALAIGLPAIPVEFASVFGGEQGLTVTPPVPPTGVDPQRWLTWIVLVAVLVMLVLLGNLVRSRFGRAFRAVRDDEVAAAISGISVGRTRMVAFAVSAAAAGLAGGLLGLSTGGVIPDAFSVGLSISLLAGMVLGGTGSILGAWWGAIIIVYAPQWSTTVSSGLGLRQGQSSNLALLFYGLVLIVVILVAPDGIQGRLVRLWELVARRMRGPGAGAGDGGTGSETRAGGGGSADLETEDQETREAAT